MTGELEVKNLDHLGIVAGLIDELEIEKIINTNLGKDKREKISLGQTAKAILINGLGFVSKPLYLFSRFYQDKPVERLIGEGIKAQEINDDKIGRLMDKMYEYGLEKIWLEISLKAVEKFEVKTQYSHLDSTSISVEGKYEKEEEGSIVIHHGYSKDKRPDLKQFLIKLLVSNDGDVPLLIQAGSGNEIDKKVFADFVKNYEKQIDWQSIYVGDAELYTASNLAKMGETKWITRVPLSNKKAKEKIETVKGEELEVSDLAGYKYKEERVNHHGISQRWLIVESQKRKKSDLEKLAKKRKQEREKIEKKLKKWQKGKEENLEELKVEVKQLKKTLIYHQLTDDKFFIQTDKKGKETYGYQGQITENQETIESASAKAGRFILATNVLDESELNSLDILQKYKEQQGCERGFRFLKDPLFFADSVFLKTPRRIETMAMLMGLCLLVYSLGQRQIRQELINRKETVHNQVGKPIQTPTLRWIFQVLQGIHLVNLNQEIIVSGLTEEIRNILKYFSIYCQSYYGI